MQVAISQLKFEYQSKIYTYNCLFSLIGCTMVFDDKSAPPGIEAVIGQVVWVQINGIQLQGVFQKEMQSKTAYYSLKFRHSQKSEADMAEFLTKHGAALPPRRKYPRLNIRADIDVPAPQFVFFESIKDAFFFNVINFTIGGLLIESAGANPPSLRVGQNVEFDILVTDGTQVNSVKAQIVRMEEDLSEELLGHKAYRYGVRILEMPADSRKHYHAIIKNYCRALQEKTESQAQQS